MDTPSGLDHRRVLLARTEHAELRLLCRASPRTPGRPATQDATPSRPRGLSDASTLAVEGRAAQAELDRQERLEASGVGLAVERLRAEAPVRHAESARAAAQSAAAMFGPGVGGTVTLRAPMAGVVLDVDARRGLVATPDTGPLVSVAHTEALHIRLDVYEDALRRVAVGQTVQVVPADGSSAVRGAVVEVADADAADSATRRGPLLERKLQIANAIIDLQKKHM